MHQATPSIAVVSLDQWLDKLAKWRTATRELVRLWLVNELGCQRDLANHLGLSDRAIRKHVAKLRESGDLPPLAETDGRARNQKQELSSYSAPVPTADYPSAVVPKAEQLEDDVPALPTAEELMARVLNLEAENAQMRDELQAQPDVAPVTPLVALDDSVGVVERDLNEARALLERLRELTRSHCNPNLEAAERFSELNWEELDQELSLLQEISSMRWQKLRAEVQQMTSEVAKELTDYVLASVGEQPVADAVLDGFVSSMGTEASRAADADFEEISRLVCCIEDIHARNLTTDGSGLHEQQWRGLSQQYKSIKYCADLRWSRLRAEMEREHEAFLGQLDNALPEELKARFDGADIDV